MTNYDFDSRRIEPEADRVESNGRWIYPGELTGDRRIRWSSQSPEPDDDQFRALISVATTLRWVAAGMLALVLLLGTCSVSLLASQSCATTGEGGLDPLVECVR